MTVDITPARQGMAETGSGLVVRRRPLDVRKLRFGIAYAAATLALVIGPGSFGAVATGPLILLGLALSIGLLAAPVSQVQSPTSAAAWVIIAAFALVIAVAGAQLAGHHANPLAVSAPMDMPSAKLPGWWPDTINPGATERTLGSVLISFLAFLLGLRIASTPERAWLVIKLTLVTIIGWTLTSLVLFLLDPATLLWTTKRAYLDSLTGPFVNRNTAAIYFGMGLLCLIGVARHTVTDLVRRSTRPGKADRYRHARIGLTLASILLLTLALMLTRSRAGILLSLMSASLLAFTICFRHEWHILMKRNTVLFWLLGLGTIIVTAVLLITVLDVVGQRGHGDGGRLSVYGATLQVILRAPVWGIGLGTFADVFPSVRPENLSSWGIWDRAHNTLLELALDVGLPAAGFVAAAGLFGFVMLTRGIVARRNHHAIPALGAGLMLLGGLHSMVDFPLQIPGFAAVYFMTAGACIAQARSVMSALSPLPTAQATPGQRSHE